MSMFMETKPDELIDQIFIILDEAEIKNLCPSIIKHFNIEELKEKCLNTVMGLDEAGLQSVYETQHIDADTEEIDRALIQLGLVGNNAPAVSNAPSKWITVKEEVVEEEAEEELPEEAPVPEAGEEDESIFDIPEPAPPPPPKEPELPRRLQLADKAPEATEDAEMWRAMLMKDREKLSRNLDTSVVMKTTEDEVVVKEEHVEEGAEVDEIREASPLVGNPPLIPGDAFTGNPPLIGNPPLLESPSKPRLSYRARAEAKAKENASSESESGSSSSSEEGELSEGGEEEVKERVRMKSEGEIESGEEKDDEEPMGVEGTVPPGNSYSDEGEVGSDEGEIRSDEGEIRSEDEQEEKQEDGEDEAANYAL